MTDGPPTTVPDDVVVRTTGLEVEFAVRRGLFSDSRESVRAVAGVDLDVRRGEILGLVGESGSGKTTLGRAILGLVPVTAGSVLFDGHDIAAMDERAVRPLRRRLAMVFQDPNASLNPAMTIAQGVGHPLRVHGITSTRTETRRRVVEMLERCGLSPAENFLDVYPEDLSGGQKQRVAIARALITGPEFVVADEPVAALDMSVRAMVLELMLELKEELGLTYLYITHDLSSGRFVCDRIAIMYLGRIIELGGAESVYDDPTHPYTKALFEALPLPDPSRRGRARTLPFGEIPDARRPPAGCAFHPRCPVAFEACGWRGNDLLEVLEVRFAGLAEAELERESGAFGDLAAARASDGEARFPHADLAAVRDWVERVGPRLPSRVTTAIVAVESDGGDVVVRFAPGSSPSLRPVTDRVVACHLDA